MPDPEQSTPYHPANLEDRVDELSARMRRLQAAMSELTRYSRGREHGTDRPSPGFLTALHDFERNLSFVALELTRLKGAVPPVEGPPAY